MLIPFVNFSQVFSLGGVDFLKILLLGVISTAGVHTLLVYSLKCLPVVSVALISCLQPVLAVVLAWFVLREVPGTMMIVGGLLVLSAICESVPRRT